MKQGMNLKKEALGKGMDLMLYIQKKKKKKKNDLDHVKAIIGNEKSIKSNGKWAYEYRLCK